MRAGPSPDELRHWLALLRAPGVGAVHALRLLQQFQTPAGAYAAGPAGWRQAGVPQALFQGLSAPDEAGIAQDLGWLAGDGCSLLTWDDPRYPERLRQVTHAPVALFCRGDPALLSRPQLAIVGARAATPQGIATAEGFATELARAGLGITSGLALGIDAAAHRGALAGGGLTIAVCATGLDRVYPARHRELAREIVAQGGVLVSEFPTGTAPLRDHFPRRNRIISGLARGVLVIEAAERSGSLITARLALEQGREVYAVPGSIHSPLSRGGHGLIRQGAKLTERLGDILEELPEFAAQVSPSRPAPRLDATQAQVLAALGYESTSFDAMIERLALPVGQLSSALLALELEGLIAAAPGGAYQRISRTEV